MAMCSFVPCCQALPGLGHARGGGGGGRRRAAGCTREAPHAAPAMDEPQPCRLPHGHPNPHSRMTPPLRHDVPDSRLMQQCRTHPREPAKHHQTVDTAAALWSR